MTKEEAEEIILKQVGHYAGSLFVASHQVFDELNGPEEVTRWLGVCVIDGAVFRVEKCATHTDVLVAIAKEMLVHGSRAGVGGGEG